MFLKNVLTFWVKLYFYYYYYFNYYYYSKKACYTDKWLQYFVEVLVTYIRNEVTQLYYTNQTYTCSKYGNKADFLAFGWTSQCTLSHIIITLIIIIITIVIVTIVIIIIIIIIAISIIFIIIIITLGILF